MGDSSVSCVVSNVTIYGGRAVLLALAPAWFSSPSRAHPSFTMGARVISNEGASAHFAPLFLPIFGKMNGYGSLEDIERTPHVEWLEERIGKPIEEIAEAIIQGGKLDVVTKAARRYGRSNRGTPYRKQTTWDGTLYGCFVARAIWDEFSTSRTDEWGKPAYTVWDEGWINPGVLKGMGFVKGKKDEKEATRLLGDGPHAGHRYHTPWKHPELPTFTAWCDQHMSSRFEVSGKKLADGLFNPHQLQAALKKFRLSLPASSIEWAKKTAAIETYLNEQRSLYVKTRNMDKRFREQEKKDPQITFNIIQETLPKGVDPKEQEARHKAQIQARIRPFLKNPSAEMENPTPSPLPPPVIHEGTVQVFCDQRFHVTATAGADGAMASHVITKCECKDHHKWLHPMRMKFTEAVYADLRVNGWKVALTRRGVSVSDRSYSVPEMWLLYGSKHVGRFKSEMVALLTLLHNMHAINRLLMPTPTGYQYGNHPMQTRIAAAAKAYSDAEIRKMKRY